MKKYMKYAAALTLLFGVSAVANAQNSSDEYYPNTFVSVQAGAQTTFTDYDNSKLITPQFALSVGHWFVPQFGTRFHVMGYENKSALIDTKYNYKAITGDIDFLLNISNIINPARESQAWNWLIIAGFGVNVGWDFDEFSNAVAANSNFKTNLISYDHSQSTFNGRLGTAIEYNFCKDLGVNLELQANYKNDLYNLKVNDRCDWQVAALLGLTYRFGMPKAETKPATPTTTETDYAAQEAARAEAEARAAAAAKAKALEAQRKAEQEAAAKKAVKEEPLKETVFFQIRQSDPKSDPALAKAVAWAKKYPNKTVTVTGYADKGTGTAKVNKMYSEQRAKKVADALKAQGVPADQIVVKAEGDTVQPYAENDQNRCTIMIGE